MCADPLEHTMPEAFFHEDSGAVRLWVRTLAGACLGAIVRKEDVGLRREDVEAVVADGFEDHAGDFVRFDPLVESGLEERRELLDFGPLLGEVGGGAEFRGPVPFGFEDGCLDQSRAED